MRMRLSVDEYLESLQRHGSDTFAYLIDAGYPSKLVLAKAEKAASLGLCDFGIHPAYSWITPKGLERAKGKV
jgi:hypothetical protein